MKGIYRFITRGGLSFWILMISFLLILLLTCYGLSFISELEHKDEYRRRYPFERVYALDMEMELTEGLPADFSAKALFDLVGQFPSIRKELTFMDFDQEITIDFSDQYRSFLYKTISAGAEQGVYLGNAFLDKNLTEIRIVNEWYPVKGYYYDDGLTADLNRIVVPWELLSSEKKEEMLSAAQESVGGFLSIGVRVGSERDLSLNAETLEREITGLGLNVKQMSILLTEGEYDGNAKLYFRLKMILLLFCVGYGIVSVFLWLRKKERELRIRSLFGYKTQVLCLRMMGELQKSVITAVLIFALLLWPVRLALHSLLGISPQVFEIAWRTVFLTEIVASAEIVVFVILIISRSRKKGVVEMKGM